MLLKTLKSFQTEDYFLNSFLEMKNELFVLLLQLIFSFSMVSTAHWVRKLGLSIMQGFKKYPL